MAKDTSPLCFRLSPDDRRLVEMVAAYMGQSVSDFIRSIVVGAASRVVADHGPDKIVRELDERNQKMSDERRQVFEETARRASSRAT
jgi:uncharacterized protein (DUF1778 family)